MLNPNITWSTPLWDILFIFRNSQYKKTINSHYQPYNLDLEHVTPWFSYNEGIELFVAQQYMSSALPASDKIPKKPNTIFNC